MKGNSPARARTFAIGSNLDDGSPRAVARALAIGRTGLWITQLLRKTGKTTAYALGKWAQPRTYRKGSSQNPYHHNLWAKYELGLVVPRPSLLQEVDLRVAGSSGDFHHILFEVLNPKTTILGVGDMFLRRMCPGVQRAVFEPTSLSRGQYVRRRSLSQVLRALELQGDLDGLAAAVVLLREAQGDLCRARKEISKTKKAIRRAHRTDQETVATTLKARLVELRESALSRQEPVFEIGITTHRLLLIACSIGPGARVTLELIVLVKYLALNLVRSHGRCFTTTVVELMGQCDALRRAALILEDGGQIGSRPSSWLQAMSGFFRGDYGDDLRYGLMPRLGTIGYAARLPIRSRQDVLRDEVIGRWAYSVLSSYRVEQTVPDAVLEDLCTRWDALKRSHGCRTSGQGAKRGGR